MNEPDQQSDVDPDGTQRLVRDAQRGPDATAWNSLSAKVERQLRNRYGRRRTFPLGYEFHDFQMEVQLRLLQELDLYQAREGGSFWKWLHQVAERILIDLMRREKALKRGGQSTTRAESPELLDSLTDSRTPSPTVWVRGRELAQLELEASERLGDLAKRVYRIRRSTDAPFSEISKMLDGVPEGTLRSTYKRARDTVKDIIARRLDLIDGAD